MCLKSCAIFFKSMGSRISNMTFPCDMVDMDMVDMDMVANMKVYKVAEIKVNKVANMKRYRELNGKWNIYFGKISISLKGSPAKYNSMCI